MKIAPMNQARPVTPEPRFFKQFINFTVYGRKYPILMTSSMGKTVLNFKRFVRPLNIDAGSSNFTCAICGHIVSRKNAGREALKK